MSDDPMFERFDRNGIRTLKVRGEIDLAVREEFRKQLHRTFGVADSPIYVDLSDVTFIDSNGLGVLIGAKRTGEGIGVPVILQSPSLQVRRVLEVSGLDQIFEVDDRIDADRSVAN